jgi:hypothetical protein
MKKNAANRGGAKKWRPNLAGGRGTRLAEETDVKPKPMVEIGDGWAFARRA